MLRRLRSKAKSKSKAAGRFLEAAHTGHREKVSELITKGIDVNVTNEIGVTALHLSAKEGHIEVVNELLKHGARVDATTQKGITALHVASLSGKVDLIQLLLDNNARVNIQSKEGFTPLYMAAQENHLEAVKFLLTAGASQSLTTEDGFTVLSVALQEGHDDVANVLLGHGTSQKLKLPQMHIATKKNDIRAVSLLLKRSEDNVCVVSKSGFTPLHIAAHYGNSDIGRLLIEKGASVNLRAKNGICPLHIACKRGRSRMVSLLTDNSADVNCQTKDGMTPIHVAAASGGSKIIGNLLEKGASVNAKTKNGFSALHLATQGDHVNSVKQLLLHGADIDDVSLEQLTPLHIAAHCGNVRSARLLLENGCDVNPKAMNGFTPLHIAGKRNHKEIVDLLVKSGAKVEAQTETDITPLHVASFMGHTNIVSALLRLGANPDIATSSGDTPLHLATRNKHLEAIDQLLHSRSQVDIRTADHITPLHIAVDNGDVDGAVLLLHHGASPNARTADLNTPLHLAAASSGKSELVQLLLEHGANTNSANKKGFTPLHIAAKHGNVLGAQLLLARSDTEIDTTSDDDLTPLHVAVHYNQINAALLLLSKGAETNIRVKNGCSPLHVAAAENRMNLVPHLLEHGASINAETEAGFIPLHFSTKAGHMTMTSLLLERGAAVDHATKDGLTPLHFAALGNRVPAAEALLQFGANINSETSSGLRPIHLASQSGYMQMVDFFLARDADGTMLQNMQEFNSASTEQLSDDSAVDLVGTHLDQLDQNSESSEIPLDSKNNCEESGVNSLPSASFQQSHLNPLAVNCPDEISDLFAFDVVPDPCGSKRQTQPSPCSLIRREFVYTRRDHKESTGQVPQEIKPPVTTDDTSDPLTVSSASGTEPSSEGNPIHRPHDEDPPCLFDRRRRSSSVGFTSNFLISFLVDARGSTMQGCRDSGIRVVVPPDAACQPTRITCRYVRREKLLRNPPLNDGEGFATRVLEMGPEGITFAEPVLVEISHFASLKDGKREIIVLRSDNGQRWYEHAAPSVDEETFQSIFGERDGSVQKVHIVTKKFPRYFALVSRFRHEVTAIGPEGGVLASKVVPEVQAIFPAGSIKRSTKLHLQVNPVADDMVEKVCGSEINSFSPVVTIEPRHRRFHQPIAVRIPIPKSMMGETEVKRSNLRVLASRSEGTMPAVWEDITDGIALTILNGCATLLITVSARFWLIDSSLKNFSIAKVTELYRETLAVPFLSKFVAFAKRLDETEARIRLFSITDDQLAKILENQEGFTEIARSEEVEVCDGKPIHVEVTGNLIPLTNPMQDLRINFHAFRENRLPFVVKVKDMSLQLNTDVVGELGLVYKAKLEPTDGTECSPTTICVLRVRIPDFTDSVRPSFEGKLNQRVATVDTQISKAELHITDIADILDADWLPLAVQLGLSAAEINEIRSDYDFPPEQALIMLHQWVLKNGGKATGNHLERALKQIGRADVIAACMHNISDVTDDSERLVAKTYISNSDSKDELASTGFNGTLSSRESSIRRRALSDVSYGDLSSLPDSRSFCCDTSSEVSSVAGKDEYSKSAFDDRSDDRCFYVDGSINSAAYATMRSIESEESDAVLSDDANDIEIGGMDGQQEAWTHPQWKDVVLRRSKDEARVMADASVRLSQVSDVTMTPEDGEDVDRERTPCAQEILVTNNEEERFGKDLVKENFHNPRSLQNHPEKEPKQRKERNKKEENSTKSAANVAGNQNIKEILDQNPHEFDSKVNHFESMDFDNSDIVIEVAEGDIYLRTDICEVEEILDDETKVKRRTITRKQVRPVEERFLRGDVILETRFSERVVRIEIDEDITELEPGVDGEYGAHLICDTTTEEVEDMLADGVVVQKRITKVHIAERPSYSLEKSETDDSFESSNNNFKSDVSKDIRLHKLEEAEPFGNDTVSRSNEFVSEKENPNPYDANAKQIPYNQLLQYEMAEELNPNSNMYSNLEVIERMVGEVVQEVEECNDEGFTESGIRINRKVITTRHLLPVTEKIRTGKQSFKVIDIFELGGTEIEEEITETPAEADDCLEAEEETSVEESEETLPDGTWLRKKITHRSITPKKLTPLFAFGIDTLNSELSVKHPVELEANDSPSHELKERPELHWDLHAANKDETQQLISKEDSTDSKNKQISSNDYETYESKVAGSVLIIDQYKDEYDQAAPRCEETSAMYDQTQAVLNQVAPEYDQKSPGYDQMAATCDQTVYEYDQTAPGYDQTTPGYDQAAATYDQTAYEYGNTAAIYDETQAVFDQITPKYGETAPGYDQPAPEYDHTAPGYDQMAATCDQTVYGYDQTATVCDQTLTVFDQTAPEYDHTAPGYDQTTPGYDQAATSDKTAYEYGKAAAIYDETQAVFDQITPKYGETSPGYGQPAPEYDHTAPAYDETAVVHDQTLTEFDKKAPEYDPNDQMAVLDEQAATMYGNDVPFEVADYHNKVNHKVLLSEVELMEQTFEKPSNILDVIQFQNEFDSQRPCVLDQQHQELVDIDALKSEIDCLEVLNDDGALKKSTNGNENNDKETSKETNEKTLLNDEIKNDAEFSVGVHKEFEDARVLDAIETTDQIDHIVANHFEGSSESIGANTTSRVSASIGEIDQQVKLNPNSYRIQDREALQSTDISMNAVNNVSVEENFEKDFLDNDPQSDRADSLVTCLVDISKSEADESVSLTANESHEKETEKESSLLAETGGNNADQKTISYPEKTVESSEKQFDENAVSAATIGDDAAAVTLDASVPERLKISDLQDPNASEIFESCVLSSEQTSTILYKADAQSETAFSKLMVGVEGDLSLKPVISVKIDASSELETFPDGLGNEAQENSTMNDDMALLNSPKEELTENFSGNDELTPEISSENRNEGEFTSYHQVPNLPLAEDKNNHGDLRSTNTEVQSSTSERMINSQIVEMFNAGYFSHMGLVPQESQTNQYPDDGVDVLQTQATASDEKLYEDALHSQWHGVDVVEGMESYQMPLETPLPAVEINAEAEFKTDEDQVPSYRFSDQDVVNNISASSECSFRRYISGVNVAQKGITDKILYDETSCDNAVDMPTVDGGEITVVQPDRTSQTFLYEAKQGQEFDKFENIFQDHEKYLPPENTTVADQGQVHEGLLENTVGSDNIIRPELSAQMLRLNESHVELKCPPEIPELFSPATQDYGLNEQNLISDVVHEESHVDDPYLMHQLNLDPSERIELANSSYLDDNSFMVNHSNIEPSEILAKYGFVSNRPTNTRTPESCQKYFLNEDTQGMPDELSFQPFDSYLSSGLTTEETTSRPTGIGYEFSERTSITAPFSAPIEFGVYSESSKLHTGDDTTKHMPYPAADLRSLNLTPSQDIREDVTGDRNPSCSADTSEIPQESVTSTPRSKRISFSRAERRLARGSQSQEGSTESVLPSPLADTRLEHRLKLTTSMDDRYKEQDPHAVNLPVSPSKELYQTQISGEDITSTASISKTDLKPPFSRSSRGFDVKTSPSLPKFQLPPDKEVSSPTDSIMQRLQYPLSSARQSSSTSILDEDDHSPALSNRSNCTWDTSFSSDADISAYTVSEGKDIQAHHSPLSTMSLTSPVGRDIPFRRRVRRRSSRDSITTDPPVAIPTTPSADTDFQFSRNESSSLPPLHGDLYLPSRREVPENFQKSSAAPFEQEPLSPTDMPSFDDVPASRRPSILHSTLEAHARFLDAIAKIDEIAPGLILSPTLMGPDVTQETVKGKIQCSTSEHEERKIETDDRTIMKKSTIIRYSQPVTRNFFQNGVLIDTRNSEIILGKYVDDYVYDSPKEISSLFDLNGETSTSVDVSEETLSDGTWLKQKTTRVVVGPSVDGGQSNEQTNQKFQSSSTQPNTALRATLPPLASSKPELRFTESGKKQEQDLSKVSNIPNTLSTSQKSPLSKDLAAILSEMQERANSSTGTTRASLQAILGRLEGLTRPSEKRQLDKVEPSVEASESESIPVDPCASRFGNITFGTLNSSSTSAHDVIFASETVEDSSGTFPDVSKTAKQSSGNTNNEDLPLENESTLLDKSVDSEKDIHSISDSSSSKDQQAHVHTFEGELESSKVVNASYATDETSPGREVVVENVAIEAQFQDTQSTIKIGKDTDSEDKIERASHEIHSIPPEIESFKEQLPATSSRVASLDSDDGSSVDHLRNNDEKSLVMAKSHQEVP